MRSKVSFVRYLLSVLFLLILWCSVATGRILYVDTDAVAEYDGSSWASAYLSLWDAIADVRPGDEIRVAQGTYQPDRRTTIVGGGRTGHGGKAELTASGDRTATFDLINVVTFKGGYAGYGEPYPDVRDIKRYETILSGDLAGDDADDPEDRAYPSSRAENSYHVLTGGGNAVLDGFTITGGNANDSPHRQGGALYNQYGTVHITRCTFRNNSAALSGGAIYNYRANPRLENCVFLANSSGENGGGMYNDQGSPILINCRFSKNSTNYGGGAMRNHESSPSLDSCTFMENSAFYGGGIYNFRSDPVLTSCAFRANLGKDYAGGIYNFDSNPVLTNCLFTANEGNLYGGGISCHNSDAVLTNCTFTGNRAPNGTALAFNGGRSNVWLTNCILWPQNPVWINDQSRVDISYSNITGGWPGEGNIDVNSLFVYAEGPDGIGGTEDDDFRLSPLSRCVDAGDPSFAPGTDETDADGNPRVIGGRVDMGAYEFQGILHVDDDVPDEGWKSLELAGTEHYPFKTIQEAIDAAKDGYTVVVQAGVYSKIDFIGQAITVKGTDGAAVIEAPPPEGQESGEDAVTFHTGEGPDSVLKNFVIRNSGMAVSLNSRSSPTISNLTIVDNDFGIAAYENSNPRINNCIFWNNRDGDLFDCYVRYSCIEGGSPGEGNISIDPLFVDAANGDYHLKSEGWRWNSDSASWTWDDVTSWCIDAGDPGASLADELMSVPRDPDNTYGVNRRINMGAFGGTYQASMAPFDWMPPEYEIHPPEPNPAQWAPDGEPREAPGEDRVSGVRAVMTAATATDVSGWVEYFFECTTDVSRSSGWQTSPMYSVAVGRSGQGHRFRVKVRDLYANQTEWSEELPAN